MVSNIASSEVAHAALTVAAADAAGVALRGVPVNTTDSTGGVVSKSFSTPSAAVAGDLLVASLSYKTPGLTDIANTAPSGWTKIPGELFDVSITTGSHLAVVVKTAVGGTESGTWGFASAPAGMVISVLAYSGADTTINTTNGVYPFEKYGYKAEPGGTNTTTHTAPAFTPTVAGSWGFAAFASRASETWTPGAGLTERSETKAAASAQAVLEINDSNGVIATGSPITYSSTESGGTSVQVSFAGNIKPSGQAPQPGRPTVTTGGATSVTGIAATIAGTINPNGLSTTYHFEYGTTTSYGTPTPSPDGSAGSGTTGTQVQASLSGLTAATTYHYRLVATNSAGTTNGSDATFTTSAAGSIGFVGPSTSGAAATGEKPESKVWWNDGVWWATLYDTISQTHHIFRLDRSTETWIDTGTQTDNRAATHSDTLWDGTHLYVASHVKASSSSGATSGNPARLYRYSYTPATRTYTLNTGFPVQIDNYSSETLTIDKDSTGALWATWTQGSKVYANSTTGSDTTWGTPFVLPVTGASSLDPDDISSIVAMGDKVGVMWSNQADSAMYFATHADGAAAATWSATTTVLGGPGWADDHINLKADRSGRVYAAVKTSLDDVGGSGSVPQIMLLVRDPSTGGWASYPVGRLSDCHTRPVVMLDSEHQVIYVFMTAPDSGCPFSGSDGTIFMKSSPMGSVSFPLGRGTPVIRDAVSPHLNNVTSSKQSVTSATGLVIMASNDTTQRYWHADIPLG
ncbi:hypothetical protein ABT369_08620 [Dactylosporangium sp. NPDC000244]|uniref:hypothetical protein n=1 Tax=Dactylosporangium sp. NPDC000244 TaxID=3154365 RepID=UPI00332EAB5B